LGLASIQLLPTAELYLHANITKASSLFIFNNYLLHPLELLTILIPNYYGSSSTYNYWGRVDYTETVIYFGLLPFMFLFIALFKRKKISVNHIPFFIFSLLATIFLVIDSPVTKALYSLPIPIIATGIPERIFIISSLCFSLLAGYGINYWIFSKDKLKTYIKPLGLIFLIALSIFLWTFIAYKLNISCPFGRMTNCRLISLRNTLLELVPFVVGILAFIAYFFTKHPFKKFLSYGIVLLIFCIGIYDALKFMPYSSSSSFNPPNVLMSKLQSYSNGRIFGLGSGTIATDLSTSFKFYDAQYYHPLYIRRYGELVSYGNSGSKTKTLTRSDINIVNNISLPKNDEVRRQRLFDLLGISYIFYKKSELPKNIPYSEIVWENKDWVVYKNSTALPRIYFASSYILYKSDDKILNFLFAPTFEPGKTVALEQNPHLILGGSKGKIFFQHFSENTVNAEVSTEKAGLLVINDNYYPGWKAFIDGKETQIFRTNYSFRSVVIPPGTHTLTMTYEPLTFRVGFYITVLSCVVFILFILSCEYVQSKKRKSSAK
jgi:hypothetical protein